MSGEPTGEEALPAVAAAFGLPGRWRSGARLGRGHIHDTFLVVMEDGAVMRQHVLQRINHGVFRDVPALMDNIGRVTAHLHRRLAAVGRPDAARRALRLVPTPTGAPVHRSPDGAWWRCYDFIAGATAHDVVRSPGQAREAARACGAFTVLLADLPGGRLHETIPHFHDTRRRFAALESAARADVAGRAASAAAELDFARERAPLAGVLLDLQARGVVPERITHNDTKLNNVLLDDATGEGLCVIDLDTVMPGLAPYDFGDLVRTATNPVAEDETDLARVQAQLPVFAALAEGFLASAGAALNDAEVAHLVFAGRLMTLEVGIRFLADHLAGDVYFKVHRPGHNLDRARNQFALLRSLEAQAPAMEQIVARLARR